MLSLGLNEYLIFLSKYFSIDSDKIIQKSIEHNIISSTDSPEAVISKLKESIGYQRRLIEPLAVAFTKSTPFDTLVSLVTCKVFDNHVSLLVVDQDNILKIIYFLQEYIEFNYSIGSVLKIDSCYVKDGSAKTNQPPREIWFIDFPKVFTVREYYLDNLPECIYDEEYTKKTNLVTIIGYFLTYTTNDKLFCFIHSRELQIRLIPYKLVEIKTDFSTKLVKITYCELDYGPDGTAPIKGILK